METIRHLYSDLAAFQFAKALIHAPGIFRYRVQSVGWRAALAWSGYQVKNAFGLVHSPYLKIRSGLAKFPLFARLGGSSDMRVFSQIFHCNEYASVRSIPSAQLILDLGANVGYSSAYFLSCFPNATVIAVEPDPANFELCRRNLAPYGDRAQVVLGAVWSKRSRLVLSRGSFGDGLEWATQVRECEVETDEACVEAWDVPSLLQMVNGRQVDLLKIDIERSELAVFGENSPAWLESVRNICIELHGQDCEATFLKALQQFDFDLGTCGELTIARNLTRKRAA